MLFLLIHFFSSHFSQKFSWLHFIYGDREQALHNLNVPDQTNSHEHDKKYQQLFKFMKDNENNLREGGRLEQDIPLRICSSNEHNNNLKEPKTPTVSETLHEDSSFQNTNFVCLLSCDNHHLL